MIENQRRVRFKEERVSVDNLVISYMSPSPRRELTLIVTEKWRVARTL